MKILFQTYDTFRQNAAGGVNTKLTSLYEELISQGHKVDLFDKWTTKIEDYDVIHFFKVSIDYYNMMLYAHRINKPIVMSSIIPLTSPLKTRLNIAIGKYAKIHNTYELTRNMLLLSDIVITESKTESEFIGKNYNIPKNKLIALPNGISKSVLNGDPNLIRRELPFNDDFVLQVGRIDSNKNLLATIRALKGTGIPLVVIGGPDNTALSYYQKCIDESDKNVIYLGWIPSTDQKLSAAYAAAKAIVLPSINEIYGNVIMEGGANGCAIACSNTIPFCDWNLNVNIHMFDPHSVSDIRTKVIEAFHSDKNENQTYLFKDFFSWKRVADEHYNIYENLLRSKL